MPEHVGAWPQELGPSPPLEDMESHIRAGDRWMRALGDSHDHRDTNGVGRVHEAHRRLIRFAMRMAARCGLEVFAEGSSFFSLPSWSDISNFRSPNGSKSRSIMLIYSLLKSISS